MKHSLPGWVEQIYENLFLKEKGQIGRRIITARRARLITAFGVQGLPFDPLLEQIVSEYLTGSIDLSAVDIILSLDLTKNEFLKFNCEDLALLPKVGPTKISKIQNFQKHLQQRG